jgi:hypothetical protein
MGKYIGKKVLWAIICILGVSVIVFTIIYFSPEDPASIPLAKPVIYLYPESETDVEVRLELDGKLDFTYPAYDDGWRLTAYPDGRLINHADSGEYSYLFWEGYGYYDFDMSAGFVVAGCDTAGFLREKLAFLGLRPNEYNDFIVYWAPKMQPNAYNLITFQKDAYTDSAKLDIYPAPDSVLRVFMAYTPLDKPLIVPEQELESFERVGFTVVEWGGAKLNNP